MGAALQMPYTLEKSERITDQGRKAASNFAASQLASALSSQEVFKPWEVRAIVDSYFEVLNHHGEVTESELAATLHSHQIPRDLAEGLAKVLSRRK